VVLASVRSRPTRELYPSTGYRDRDAARQTDAVTHDRATRGRLLVATPPLEDPNFDRTVVFMLEHNDEGAIGVVLNRFDEVFRTLDALASGIDALASWEPLLAPPARLHTGGPVGGDSLIALAAATVGTGSGWGGVTSDIGTVDLTVPPDEVGAALHQVRVFRGYSGGGAGQLEGELDAGAWMVFDALPTDVFTAEPSSLWRTVVRRQGGTTAWFADAPDDLSAN
jgi:putative transcriptional regulator